ncbi:GntR family transcriptional regulator [Paenibacillus nasutitermitis]|uniref:GntR family transcriptional regulator n=1 Tax=Paenibacillus nasutitermitis TaxID=1652958 RepID=A0A917DPF4_9BACL|nr:GntR family transcriptional regulator [Paenibacillus nasutitermitis]GGD53855.1 GntR family transcriptional regulator [Paenibacillus nasutitermitis]
MDLPKIQTSNLFDQVYITLKQLIIRRTFRSNEKISIPVLAKNLGISITPIREALNRLEAEGLVKTVPKVGTFVVGIDKSYVEQVIEFRLMIDYWVIEQYRQFSAERFEEIAGRLDQLTRHAVAEVDPAVTPIEQYGHFDMIFHTEFINACGNIQILETYQNLMNFRILTVGNPTPKQYNLSMTQHREIVDQLLKQDWQGTRDGLRQHLNYSKQNLIDWIDSNGGEV